MKNERHTLEYVKNYVEKYGYTLLSKEYINARAKIEVQCPEGHVYKVTWNNFQRGERCIKCHQLAGKGGHQTKDLEDIRKELAERGVELLSDYYKNNETLLTLRCDKGHVYTSTWLCLQRGGTKCSKCQYITIANKLRKKPADVLACFRDKGYDVLNVQEYIDAKTSNLEVMCPNGHLWVTDYGNFKQGNRCPHCSMSAGEQDVSVWLDNSIYSYKYNHPIKEITENKYSILKFDFRVLNEKQDFVTYIEFDGQQHFMANDWFDKGESLEARQKRDKIKDDYCAENKLRLLRVPYTKRRKIPEILDNYFQSIEKGEI